MSLGTSKPMDIFRGWDNYVERLSKSWEERVQPEDTVVLAGDISWAMKLADCEKDFAFLQNLPGQKLLLKGNHDYWWSTASKMERFFTESGFTTLKLLHNNCYLVDGVALCGTRSWLFDVGEAHDEKVMNRERGRLVASLEAAQAADVHEKIVFLHYPPVCATARAEEILQILHDYGVKRCYYGHLHGASIARAVQGQVEGITYRLISADAVQFCPVRVETGEP